MLRLIHNTLLLGILLTRSALGQSPVETHLQSPDGKLEVVFAQKETSPGKPNAVRRQMTYRVNFQKKPVILESGLDIQIDNHIFEQAMAQKISSSAGSAGAGWCDNLSIKNVVRIRNAIRPGNPFMANEARSRTTTTRSKFSFRKTITPTTN
jgi:hypothetical protein